MVKKKKEAENAARKVHNTNMRKYVKYKSAKNTPASTSARTRAW